MSACRACGYRINFYYLVFLPLVKVTIQPLKQISITAFL